MDAEKYIVVEISNVMISESGMGASGDKSLELLLPHDGTYVRVPCDVSAAKWAGAHLFENVTLRIRLESTR